MGRGVGGPQVSLTAWYGRITYKYNRTTFSMKASRFHPPISPISTLTAHHHPSDHHLPQTRSIHTANHNFASSTRAHSNTTLPNVAITSHVPGGRPYICYSHSLTRTPSSNNCFLVAPSILFNSFAAASCA